VLPSMGSEYATGETSIRGGTGKSRSTKGMAKALVDGVREWVRETGELMGFWRGDRARRYDI
jgi:hypothetical protein